MNITNDDRQIIALEIRRSCFGYAVLEGPKLLLDWGATTPFPLKGSTARAQQRFRSLMKLLTPEAVVVKIARSDTQDNALFQFVEREAARQMLPFIILSSTDLQQAFSIFAVRNKHDIAEVLTRIFPELLSRLPLRRRRWEKEAHVMTVFGAVATGFAYWQMSISELGTPD